MTPIEILTLANGIAALLEMLVPKIQQLVQAGEITVEQQAALMAKIEALRPNADGAPFNTPQWKLSTDK